MDNSGLPPLPDGLEPLEHQLAGHKFGHENNSDLYGILDCKDGTILKPVLQNKKGEREKYFYELVYGEFNNNKYFRKQLYSNRAIQQLRDFVPQYFGTECIEDHPDVIYIKMVDITNQFYQPHIIDVKIGAKAWAPDSCEEKVMRQKARCPFLDEIKFQVLGARYYDAVTGKEIVKLDLRKYSPNDLQYKGLPHIFQRIPHKARQSIIRSVSNKLNDIEQWFRNQSLLSFHGSSVLITFEGDLDILESTLKHADGPGCFKQVDSIVKVKMIDFVHVWETSDTDLNYIEGVQSLQKYLIKLLDYFDSTKSVIST